MCWSSTAKALRTRKTRLPSRRSPLGKESFSGLAWRATSSPTMAAQSAISPPSPKPRRPMGLPTSPGSSAAIVGEEVARHAKPLRLTFPKGERRDGSLVLRVRSAFAVELQHMAPQLLERINGYLGYGAVARLKFEQGRLPRPRPAALLAPQGLDPAEEKKLARDLGRIEDPELRQALEGLGRAVKGLRRHPNPAK